MKKIFFAIATICIFTFSSFAQTAVKASDEKQITEVFNEYLRALRSDAKERDAARERLLTDDYFYLGVDGIPAAKRAVIERQQRNGFRINSLQVSDLVVHFYNETAILTFRYDAEGMDKGQAWGGTTDAMTTVLVKQKGVWRVAADIVGREVKK